MLTEGKTPAPGVDGDTRKAGTRGGGTTLFKVSAADAVRKEHNVPCPEAIPSSTASFAFGPLCGLPHRAEVVRPVKAVNQTPI